MNNPFFNLQNSEDPREIKLVKKKYMILLLGKTKFALPLSEVREVLAPPPVTLLPHMPSYFAGVINLRGKIISVVDLKKSLSSFEESPKNHGGKRPCIIITDIKGIQFGALVDDVTEVISVNKEEVDHSLNEELQGERAYQGVIKLPDHYVAPILNMEMALRIDELRQIQSMNLSA